MCIDPKNYLCCFCSYNPSLGGKALVAKPWGQSPLPHTNLRFVRATAAYKAYKSSICMPCMGNCPFRILLFDLRKNVTKKSRHSTTVLASKSKLSGEIFKESFTDIFQTDLEQVAFSLQAEKEGFQEPYKVNLWKGLRSVLNRRFPYLTTVKTALPPDIFSYTLGVQPSRPLPFLAGKKSLLPLQIEDLYGSIARRRRGLCRQGSTLVAEPWRQRLPGRDSLAKLPAAYKAYKSKPEGAAGSASKICMPCMGNCSFEQLPLTRQSLVWTVGPSGNKICKNKVEQTQKGPISLNVRVGDYLSSGDKIGKKKLCEKRLSQKTVVADRSLQNRVLDRLHSSFWGARASAEPSRFRKQSSSLQLSLDLKKLKNKILLPEGLVSHTNLGGSAPRPFYKAKLCLPAGRASRPFGLRFVSLVSGRGLCRGVFARESLPWRQSLYKAELCTPHTNAAGRACRPSGLRFVRATKLCQGVFSLVAKPWGQSPLPLRATHPNKSTICKGNKSDKSTEDKARRLKNGATLGGKAFTKRGFVKALPSCPKGQLPKGLVSQRSDGPYKSKICKGRRTVEPWGQSLWGKAPRPSGPQPLRAIVLGSSGRVVTITKTQLVLQKTQPVLFYSSAHLHVKRGEWVKEGSPILTLTHQTLITGDIVQGIPRIEQLFEAFTSPPPAFKDRRTPTRFKDVHDTLHSQVRDIFRKHWLRNVLPIAVRKSLEEIGYILVEMIQKVYLSQGVLIADKHIEIVVRQIASKGQILDSGTTGLFLEEVLPVRQIENANLTTPGKKCLYMPAVMGLTAASLNSDSFVSAASFQETTRVLSRDAVVGKSDFLRGLKEKVVIGDLISAGTGLEIYFVYTTMLLC